MFHDGLFYSVLKFTLWKCFGMIDLSIKLLVLFKLLYINKSLLFIWLQNDNEPTMDENENEG